jgi:DNA polymerase III, chi subunit
MTEIRFYHLQKSSLEDALPPLLSKAVESGKKVVLRLKDDQTVSRMNDHLWTFQPDSFLPHGSKKEGYSEHQPVYLTSQTENPNGASVLIYESGIEDIDHTVFDLCCQMLNGRDDTQVTQARTEWKALKDAGHSLTYWQQTAEGRWEEKS